jgi:hypothetical protein
LKGVFEKKNQLNERTQKKIKTMKIKIKIKIIFLLKGEIEKKINLTKDPKNQKKRNQIEKYNI